MSLSVFAAAREAPHAEALVCDGERSSFSALAARVGARRAELDALGVRPLDPRPIALIVDGSPAMFEYLYLCLGLGVPLLPLHPRLTGPEREHLMRESGAQLALDPSHSGPAIGRAFEACDWPSVPESCVLAFVPSSGSTGQPKLVELSRRAFMALTRADARRVPARVSDRALLCLPLSHVGGLSVVIRSLAARRCCVAFRTGENGLLGSVPELAQCLIDERVSLLSLVPAVLARLLREAPALASHAPLRAILLGGQACSLELFGAARERSFPVLTSYGLTETCSQVSTLEYPPPLAPPLKNGVVGAGFPLDGIEVRVDHGLIRVRGSTLFNGYTGGAAPFDEQGFFQTGDRGELDSELGLFVFGRSSELIITGGENVDPVEVEHALLACDGIEAAVVFGVPDSEFGEQVSVALEPSAGVVFDERALFAALDRRLASFKQPRALCLFETLPRLGSGKLDRAQIRARAATQLRPISRGPRASR